MNDNPQPVLLADQAIRDLTAALDARLPAIMEQFADLLGKSAPRIPASERRRFMTSLRRRLKRLWPAFQELDALASSPESLQKAETIKAALRAVMVEMFAPARIRKSPDAQSLEWLVQIAARATKPPRAAWTQHPPYPEARAHLWNVLMSVLCAAAFPPGPRRARLMGR